jgi:soluble lytic murein transglycosylase-like protein
MQLRITLSTDRASSKHAPIFPYRDGPKHVERPCNSQRNSRARAVSVQNMQRHSRGVIALVGVVMASIVCQMTTSTALESNTRAQTETHSESIDRFAGFIAEASARFAVPESWIRAVMQIESGGDRHATSPRGALGLMQLMPGTWVEITARYGLGFDPFDPHDNIFAGAAYLAEMHERFGSTGFLAAYHAGPTRYEQHLSTGKSIPQDTVAYVAAVTSLLAQEQGEHAASSVKRAIPWREAPLFIERAGAP